MRALAVDTSTATAGIAVADENGLLAEFLLKDKKTHSQKLIPMMKEVLDSLKLDLSDIDVFAAVTGPGSFTGLRIGVTTIKTIAYALKKPVVGIPSLDALANAAVVPDGTLVCPIMDARNNQVYTALYKPKNGLMENLSGYMGVHISELAKQIGEKYPGTNILFAGDGVPLHMDFLKIELKERCSFMPPFTYQAMAAPAAQLALTLHARGESADCTGLVPFYLRPSQAEREYEKRHAQESREHGSSIGQ
ncbi:MAG: tRNA (adenosine(37)-N6)-threonylcarbamoyltransferase complex dimerization subunit type 1 TsaB [Clostridiaceae bacterium]|nr:tRNA (adenosine(37)-N6)-threonylcarbamoyltransferase complex dimerization subunit type 1 TsaB [Clostridiaceae bacterium]